LSEVSCPGVRQKVDKTKCFTEKLHEGKGAATPSARTNTKKKATTATINSLYRKRRKKGKQGSPRAGVYLALKGMMMKEEERELPTTYLERIRK